MAFSEHAYEPRPDSNTWGTPDEVLNPIYEHFGDIGLDPCGSYDRRLCALHTVVPYDGPGVPQTEWAHLRAMDGNRPGGYMGDGLAYSWDNYGLVFVNPPFNNAGKWAEKAAKEGDEVILLLPVRTGSKWWQTFVAPADVILFWRGRLTFVGAKDIAPFHCALIYWGERPELFLKAFPGHWYVRNASAPPKSEPAFEDLTGTPPSMEDVQEARAVVQRAVIEYILKIPVELAVQLPNIDRCLAVAETALAQQHGWVKRA